MHALLEQLRFASDATIAALWAGGLLLVALLAWLADLRRMKRKQVDAVGCMPWTNIYFLALFAALALLLFAIKGWLGK